MTQDQRIRITEAAKLAGISRDMLLYFCKKGRGPAGAENVAGRWVFDPEALKGWRPGTVDRGRPPKAPK